MHVYIVLKTCQKKGNNLIIIISWFWKSYRPRSNYWCFTYWPKLPRTVIIMVVVRVVCLLVILHNV